MTARDVRRRMWIPPAWLFDVTRASSATMRVATVCVVVGAVLVVFARRRSLGIGIIVATLGGWGLLHATEPPWQRLARSDMALSLDAPTFTSPAPGLEVATYRLLDGSTEVEVVDLVRFDPALYTFTVVNDPDRPVSIESWRERLDAVAVVNGSYYLPDRTPQTPLRGDARALGPPSYSSSHGAFVADAERGTAAIVDLADVELPRGLRPFPQAMVSYPLLLAADGSSRAEGSRDWLASRTFVAIDRSSRVVLGTSHHGYFSLKRLAAFLRSAPLELVTALNLDGGPIAAQAVSAGSFSRVTVGDAETNSGNDLLRARVQAVRHLHPPLPIVLAVRARDTVTR